jgi:hypothetical protein
MDIPIRTDDKKKKLAKAEGSVIVMVAITLPSAIGINPTFSSRLRGECLTPRQRQRQQLRDEKIQP